MGNTWNHSSVLQLYASIVDRPANTHRTCIKNTISIYTSIHFLLTHKRAGTIESQITKIWRWTFTDTPAQTYLCCHQSPPQRTGVHSAQRPLASIDGPACCSHSSSGPSSGHNSRPSARAMNHWSRRPHTHTRSWKPHLKATTQETQTWTKKKDSYTNSLAIWGWNFRVEIWSSVIFGDWL